MVGRTFLHLIFAFTAICGCVSDSSRLTTTVQWPVPRPSLGRVLVLCELQNIGPESSCGVKREHLVATTERALRGLTDTEVISATGEGSPKLVANILASWRTKDEQELIDEARESGIDTLCQIHAKDYVVYIALGLIPIPAWQVSGELDYNIRLLDVKTGNVMIDSFGQHEISHYFGFDDPTRSLTRSFEDDLQVLMVGHGGVPSVSGAVVLSAACQDEHNTGQNAKCLGSHEPRLCMQSGRRAVRDSLPSAPLR